MNKLLKGLNDSTSEDVQFIYSIYSDGIKSFTTGRKIIIIIMLVLALLVGAYIALVYDLILGIVTFSALFYPHVYYYKLERTKMVSSVIVAGLLNIIKDLDPKTNLDNIKSGIKEYEESSKSE